jgi:type II secretory pathway pseudopilin PulG
MTLKRILQILGILAAIVAVTILGAAVDQARLAAADETAQAAASSQITYFLDWDWGQATPV